MKTITLNEHNVRVLQDALELYMRVGMGQIPYLAEVIQTHEFEGEDWTKGYDAETLSDLCEEVARTVFGFDRGASFAIRSPRVPKSFRTAADMLFALRAEAGEVQYVGMPPVSDAAPIKVEDVGDF